MAVKRAPTLSPAEQSQIAKALRGAMIDRYSVMVVAKFPTVLMTGEGVIVRVILSEHLAAEVICDCGCLKALTACAVPLNPAYCEDA